VAGAILALDVGTTSMKGMLVDESGQILGIASVPQRSPPTAHGWLDACRDVMATLRTRLPGATIAMVSVTGQMHGTQRYTPEGTPLGPAQVWTDRRAAPHLPALLAAAGPSLPTRIGSTIAPGYQALNLFVEDRWAAIGTVVLPKDALVHALTGAFVTDPSDAAGTGLWDGGSGTWAWDIVDALGIPRRVLPDVVSTGVVVGEVRSDAGGIAPGTPVVLAGGDTPVAAAGAGLDTGDAVQMMLSTSAQVLHPTDTWEPHPEAMWYTWPSALPTGPRWLRSGTISNGGAVVDWLASIQGAVDVPTIAPTPVVMLPHLAGRRFPLADATVSGAFVGLRGTTTREDLYAAVLQGIAFSFREVYDAMMAERPGPRAIRFGGGGSAIPGFASLLATVIGRSIERIAGSELTCIGAARIAAHSLNWTPPTMPARDLMEPDMAVKARFDEIYEIYREANAAVLPVSHALSALPW
jgi:xylulokinase